MPSGSGTDPEPYHKSSDGRLCQFLAEPTCRPHHDHAGPAAGPGRRSRSPSPRRHRSPRFGKGGDPPTAGEGERSLEDGDGQDNRASLGENTLWVVARRAATSAISGRDHCSARPSPIGGPGGLKPSGRHVDAALDDGNRAGAGDTPLTPGGPDGRDVRLIGGQTAV